MKVLFLACAGVFATLPAHAMQYYGCDANQSARLNNYATRTAVRLDEITRGEGAVQTLNLGYVRDQYVRPQMRVPIFYSNMPERTEQAYTRYHEGVQGTLQSMLDQTRTGYDFRCRGTQALTCLRDPEKLAFVVVTNAGPIKEINLCPIFFTKAESVQQRTVFHELSHVARNTDDFPPEVNWSFDRISNEWNDAYHIERFMDYNPEGVLRSEIWLRLWRRMAGLFSTEWPPPFTWWVLRRDDY